MILDSFLGGLVQLSLLQQRRKEYKNNKPPTFKSGVYRNKKLLQNCSFFISVPKFVIPLCSFLLVRGHWHHPESF